ncbi:MAG: hypothetical protein ACOWWM_02505 [Desulfobacterales bacterium]
MILYNGIYRWEGWGGVLKLASGRCRMWIFDLNRMRHKDDTVIHLRPFLVVVADLPKEGMSKREVTIRSACGHIATRIIEAYGVDPGKLLFVEYFPETEYGKKPAKVIPAVLDAVDFTWKNRLALEPRRRPLASPLREKVLELVSACADPPPGGGTQ